jgi:hypothetical protein
VNADAGASRIAPLFFEYSSKKTNSVDPDKMARMWRLTIIYTVRPWITAISHGAIKIVLLPMSFQALVQNYRICFDLIVWHETDKV